jgi:hypothetical protein
MMRSRKCVLLLVNLFRTGIRWSQYKCCECGIIISAQLCGVLHIGVYEYYGQVGIVLCTASDLWLDEASAVGENVYFAMLRCSFITNVTDVAPSEDTDKKIAANQYVGEDRSRPSWSPGVSESLFRPSEGSSIQLNNVHHIGLEASDCYLVQKPLPAALSTRCTSSDRGPAGGERYTCIPLSRHCRLLGKLRS